MGIYNNNSDHDLYKMWVARVISKLSLFLKFSTLK